jgi:hypothetical protein
MFSKIAERSMARSGQPLRGARTRRVPVLEHHRVWARPNSTPSVTMARESPQTQRER